MSIPYGFRSRADAERVARAALAAEFPNGVSVVSAGAADYRIARVRVLVPNYVRGHGLGRLAFYNAQTKREELRDGDILVRFSNGTSPPAFWNGLASPSGFEDAPGGPLCVFTADVPGGYYYGYYGAAGDPGLDTVHWTAVVNVACVNGTIVQTKKVFRLTGPNLLLSIGDS